MFNFQRPGYIVPSSRFHVPCFFLIRTTSPRKRGTWNLKLETIQPSIFNPLVGLLAISALLLTLAPQPLLAQSTPTAPTEEKSGLKAFALNLLLPGLGQRYLNDGDWSGWATVFTGADVSLALGLAGTIWHRQQQIAAYRTLAAGSAGARIEGKNRAFFLQMTAYRSQEAYVKELLRTRRWDQVDVASDAARSWSWSSEDAWERYKSARSKADALSRRRSVLITALVANRLLSGVLALLQARGDGNAPQTAVTVRPGPNGQLSPRLTMQFRW